MNLKSATSYSNWTKMTSGFLSKEERVVLLEDGSRQAKPFSEIVGLMNSKNQEGPGYGGCGLQRHPDRSTWTWPRRSSTRCSRTRRSTTSSAARPGPTRSGILRDDIESEVVDTLIDAVSSRFDIPARFYRLKAKLLKVKKLKYHERNVEYGGDRRTVPLSRRP